MEESLLSRHCESGDADVHSTGRNSRVRPQGFDQEGIYQVLRSRISHQDCKVGEWPEHCRTVPWTNPRLQGSCPRCCWPVVRLLPQSEQETHVRHHRHVR